MKHHVLQVTGFDPEDLAVDVGHWFKGSTNGDQGLRVRIMIEPVPV